MNYDKHSPLKDPRLNKLSVDCASYLDPKFALAKQPLSQVLYTIFAMLVKLARILDEK